MTSLHLVSRLSPRENRAPAPHPPSSSCYLRVIVSSCDVAVVGGGIVGLAVAHELSARGREVVVLEKEPRLAAHQSGRNSGEIHSGIYYKPGSLKARLCVQGAEMMKAFCRAHAIPLEVCGKVIVATREEELPRLDDLVERGRANGVPGVESVGPEKLREIEPHATGLRAVWVPGVAITDYAAVTRELARTVSRVLTGTRVLSIRGGTLQTTAGAFEASTIVTCAGLHSDRFTRTGARIVPFRGEYATLRRPELVRGLIYPAPDPRLPFLGIHFTRRITGQVEAGPNAVLALKREGYSWKDVGFRDILHMIGFSGFWRMAAANMGAGIQEVRRSLSRRKLLRDMQRLVPDVRISDLLPGRSGVRAQAVEPEGALIDDFRVIRRGEAVHVVNAPSPAATASLAIARYIVDEIIRPDK